ncbi:hypothetical protein C5S36_05295, partial [Candidatus Methanophagaceae archaeon]
QKSKEESVKGEHVEWEELKKRTFVVKLHV